ncbi:MAG: HAMP domain-containing protein [Deltaproteobacteria bacterium]|nr:HAMP domain-containing protein [Deltaproteobacteria bacterium]
MLKSLQQRLFLFLVLPVSLLLIILDFFGFFLARNIMLDEWRESAILRLERASNSIDTNLSKIMKLTQMFQSASLDPNGSAVQEWLLNQLRLHEGVVAVELDWTDERLVPGMPPDLQGQPRLGFRRHVMRSMMAPIKPPSYDAVAGLQTVTLASNFVDDRDKTVGTLRVTVSFAYLMKDVQRLGWWQSDLACLVDNTGHYLAHTKAMDAGHSFLGATNDSLELGLLEDMKKQPFGTRSGRGHPPDRIAGFYKMKNVPWVIIIYAPGVKVRAPIVRFRDYYAIGGAGCLLIIVILIRLVAGSMARSIRNISLAADEVAKGNYGEPLPVTRRDELGQLIISFNTMVRGLRERDFIRDTFGRYMDQEIAEELLKRPEASGLGGDRRQVVVLMSDLCQFTQISHLLSPDKTISLLNSYFSNMIDIIQKHHGIIVDFLGDGMLVFFDPLDGPIPPQVKTAVCCALEMQKRMGKFNEEYQSAALTELKMRIGVTTGDVIVGNIGSEKRAKYGIVGAPVNMAHRIQSVAGPGEVVVSSQAVEQISLDAVVRRSFEVRLKGAPAAETLYVIESCRACRQSRM